MLCRDDSVYLFDFWCSSFIRLVDLKVGGVWALSACDNEREPGLSNVPVDSTLVAAVARGLCRG